MRTRQHNPRRGFTLVEVLMTLMIMAVVLAGVAVALQAALTSYTQNNHIGSVAQTGRAIMDRMSREIRTATNVNSTSTSLTITPADDGSGLQTIVYQLTSGQLHLRRTVNGTTDDAVLLGDGGEAGGSVAVGAFNVIREDAGGLCQSVKVRLTISCGSETYTAACSAALRRNQTY
ncbi:MAG: prepilin-type N-terminal cleavage/methylation domain-containing protein [Planctomycetaceae bacterium]|nr:prepilin-type N-terminal cleavage/methylation domain-containing protein [Planctomycetaceae bacterium]